MLFHLCNTNFEFELRQKEILSLKEGLGQHPVFLQLQFLPFLFAEPEDTVVVSFRPPESYLKDLLKIGWWPSADSIPQGITLDEQVTHIPQALSCWGWSRQVALWAKQQQIPYPMPSWETILKVNSKAFSFQHGVPLPHSLMLHNELELKAWLEERKTALVLKSCYGVSGRGKLLIAVDKPLDENAIRIFCKKEWDHGLPIIGEPWLDRVFDFSTQWKIDPKNGIEYVGATVMHNDALGVYRGTLSGPEDRLFGEYLSFLQEHKKHALNALKTMQKEGFYGYAGVDSMIYKGIENPQEILLHPIVEINARQTMSLIALWIQRKRYSDRLVKMSFTSLEKEAEGLLPYDQPNNLRFTKQLYLEIIQGT